MELTDLLRASVKPLTGDEHEYDRLLELIGDARYVLIGEASHGTHEFYQERAAITKRLVAEKGFTAIAVEADWPDAYRVNRYVRGTDDDADADAALSGFKRFPHLDVAQYGRARFRSVSAHPQRRVAAWKREDGLLRPRPL
jgi:erythromycin esterase-like protein